MADSELVKDILDEEDSEEKHFHELKHHHTTELDVVGGGMVHSATTDTLDSVYLEPPNPEPDGDSDLNLDLAFKEESDDASDRDNVAEGDQEAKDVSFVIEGGTHEIKETASVPSLSRYFGKEATENDPFATIHGPVDSLPEMPKVGTDSSLEGKLEDAVKDMFDLTLDDSKDFLEDVEDMNANNNQKPPDDLNIGSVDFDLALDKDDTVETPVTIEEKDAFDSFTAEVIDTDALDALGMSPATNSFMTEKTITDYFRQTSNQSDNPFNNFSRQLSQSSAKSSGSQDRASANLSDVREGDTEGAKITSSAHSETIETSIPATEISQTSPRLDMEPGSAGSTPRHQPVFPPSATLSPVDSPVHKTFARQMSVPGNKMI